MYLASDDLPTDCPLEYIGQLEGEVAAKAQEANELRTQNQQLREENTRLTDLTRMLLSSQAFSGFLQELSQSGLPAPNTQLDAQKQKAGQNQSQSQPQSAQKDVASHNSAQQMHVQQPQIGMALIPETPMDFAAFQPSNAWMTALPTNDFQVFAVTELPQAPVLDVEALSPKSSSFSSVLKSAKSTPAIPETPRTFEHEAEQSKPTQVDDSVVLDREAFALYFDSSVPACCESSADVDLTPVPTDEDITEEEKLDSLKRMCSILDAACSRLADFTPST